MLVKKKCWKYWLQVCVVRLLHDFSVSDSIKFIPGVLLDMVDSLKRMVAQYRVLTLTQSEGLCLSQVIACRHTKRFPLPFSYHAWLQYEWGPISWLVFCSAKSNMNFHGLSVSSENTSQKVFIGNDTISEIVCYQSVSISACHKKSAK
jgi:hypothetical protein